MKLHLKSGRLIDPATGKDTVTDMLIVDGKIERISQKITADSSFEIIDLNARAFTRTGI
jgi:predicted amidohydrolase